MDDWLVRADRTALRLDEETSLRVDGEGRTLAKLRWGLVPRWAMDLELGAKMVNAQVRDRAREARVPSGVPSPAMHDSGERLVRSAPREPKRVMIR